MIYKLWSKFLTWIGDLMLCTSPPRIKGTHIRMLLDSIQAGDIIARKYTYYLDSILIKGEYSHTCWVLNKNRCLHAVSEGVCEIDPIDFVKDSDGFIIIRPIYKNLFKCKEFALSRVGYPYDFMFSKKDDSRFYCHEYTNAILKANGLEVAPEHDIIYADDFIKAFGVVLRCP